MVSAGIPLHNTSSVFCSALLSEHQPSWDRQMDEVCPDPWLFVGVRGLRASVGGSSPFTDCSTNLVDMLVSVTKLRVSRLIQKQAVSTAEFWLCLLTESFHQNNHVYFPKASWYSRCISAYQPAVSQFRHGELVKIAVRRAEGFYCLVAPLVPEICSSVIHFNWTSNALYQLTSDGGCDSYSPFPASTF